MKDSFVSASASRWLASVAMLAASAGSAIACPPQECESEREIRVHIPGGEQVAGLRIQAGTIPILGNLPLVLQAPQPAKGFSIVTMTHSVDGSVYELHIENGATSAKIDGKTLPDRQIRTLPGRVELLDEKGRVVHTFSTQSNEERDWSGKLSFQAGADAVAPASPFGTLRLEPMPAIAMDEVVPPRVMMGITMSEAGDKEGLGVIVDKVMENLPAAKAGLKTGDKIISVNGDEVEDVLTFREFLGEQEPGDEIKLKVMREGKELDLTVKLEAFDAKTLDPLIQELKAAQEGGGQADDAHEEWFVDAIRAIESAHKLLQDSKVTDAQRRAAEQSLEKAIKSLNEGKAQNRAPGAWAPAAPGRLFTRDGQKGTVFVSPQTPTPPDVRSRDLENKVDRMAERLEKAMASLEARHRGESAESDAMKKLMEARLEKLTQENLELKKKIEELLAKKDGN
jgi:PDZ domain